MGSQVSVAAVGGHAGGRRCWAGVHGVGLVGSGAGGLFGVRGFTGLFAVGFGGVGALLTWRRPGHPVGWIFAAAGMVAAVDFATFEYGLAASAGHRDLLGSVYAGWVQLWIWLPFITLITVYLFLLFPGGRLPGPRWRLVSWMASGFAASSRSAGQALSPGVGRPNLPSAGVRSGLPRRRCRSIATIIGLAGLLGCAVLAAWSLSARARRGTSVERQQIKWLAYSGCLVAAGTGASGGPVADSGTAARIAAGAVFARRADDAGHRRGRRSCGTGSTTSTGSSSGPGLCNDHRPASRGVCRPGAPGHARAGNSTTPVAVAAATLAVDRAVQPGARAGCSVPWTGDSTGPGMTPTRQWRRSQPG